MDYRCDPGDSVAAWFRYQLYDGRIHSCSAGYRHRCGAGPGHYRTQTDVAVCTRKISQKRRLNA